MSYDRVMFIIVSILLIGFVTISYNGSVNLTDSEPIGYYAKVGGFPHRGGMVQLRPLMKHVAGIPGDHIQTTAQGSYINGRLWPNSGIPADTHGYKPYPFGEYTLGPNQYWLLGTGADSLDSRYIGIVSSDFIATTVTPVWIEKGTK